MRSTLDAAQVELTCWICAIIYAFGEVFLRLLRSLSLKFTFRRGNFWKNSLTKREKKGNPTCGWCDERDSQEFITNSIVFKLNFDCNEILLRRTLQNSPLFVSLNPQIHILE